METLQTNHIIKKDIFIWNIGFNNGLYFLYSPFSEVRRAEGLKEVVSMLREELA